MKYKHKTTGEEVKINEANSNLYCTEKYEQIPRRFIENSCDWEKVIEKDYEIIRYGDEKGNLWENGECVASLLGDGKSHIFSVKRISDGEIFTVGDNINFNDKGTAKLLEIQFEIAPADKGKGTLCFVNDHEFLGKWWTVDKLSRVKEPLFKTVDNVEIYEGEKVFCLHRNDDDELTGDIAEVGTTPYPFNNTVPVFAKKENAETYIKQNEKRFSLNDIEKALNIYDLQTVGSMRKGILEVLNSAQNR